MSKYVLMLALALVAGCQSIRSPESRVTNISLPAPPPRPVELATFPDDVGYQFTDAIDIQQALAQRGIYRDTEGEIRWLPGHKCPLEVVAHRGDYRYPESSIAAIKGATRNGFDTVEIDVMRLRDGLWVNHHDNETGRAAVHYSGKRLRVRNMDREQWVELRLRDPRNGSLLNERPATASEVYAAFAEHRQPNQKLNVEIKGEARGDELVRIDAELRALLGDGTYYYSSNDLAVLERLHGINQSVYLGLIEKPHPKSVELLQGDMRRGVQADAYVQSNREQFERLDRVGSGAYGRFAYKDLGTVRNLDNQLRRLGSNSGLHMDIRHYMQDPVVKARAAARGLKIYTYTVNSAHYHLDELRRLGDTRGLSLLPAGAIVDSSPYAICQRLSPGPKINSAYTPVSAKGRYIASLPDDADLEAIDLNPAYVDEGYYIALSGKVRPIVVAVDQAAEVRRASKDSTAPRRQVRDEVLDLRTHAPIRIDLEH